MNDNHFPTRVEIMVLSAAQLTAVYALLGGVSLAAVATAAPAARVSTGLSADQIDKVGEAMEGSRSVQAEPAVAGDVDTGGHPWSENLHASTKTKTKDGYWRMKVGVARPADLPGFPKDGGTGTASAPAAAASDTGSATSSAAQSEEDDEFAAFRQAAGTETAAAPARTWTDADLGALCNQAAVKLGSPDVVRTLIAEYVTDPEATKHSRNIPADKRAAFAAAVEDKAGIKFAG